MKLTTNYIVYLNADNKVQCAKCRITGRFVKLSLAKIEYEKEYNYFSFSMLTILSLFFIIYLSSVINKLENVMCTVALNLDQVLSYFAKGKTIVLFTKFTTYIVNDKVTNEKEVKQLLNSGRIIKGRVL